LKTDIGAADRAEETVLRRRDVKEVEIETAGP
jgi:hypothetical protein